MRGRTCRAVSELCRSGCIGANLARAPVGDLCCEHCDVTSRLCDCKRSARSAVERLPQPKVSRLTPRIAHRAARGEKALERIGVFLRETGSAGSKRLGLRDCSAGIGPRVV